MKKGWIALTMRLIALAGATWACLGGCTVDRQTLAETMVADCVTAHEAALLNIDQPRIADRVVVKAADSITTTQPLVKLEAPNVEGAADVTGLSEKTVGGHADVPTSQTAGGDAVNEPIAITITGDGAILGAIVIVGVICTAYVMVRRRNVALQACIQGIDDLGDPRVKQAVKNRARAIRIEDFLHHCTEKLRVLNDQD